LTLQVTCKIIIDCQFPSDACKDGQYSKLSEAPTGSNEDIPALEDSDVDPKIREGMEKIKKLDKILADKLKVKLVELYY